MKIRKQYYWIISNLWKSAKGILCLYTGLMALSVLLPTIAAYSQKWLLVSMEGREPIYLIGVALVAYAAIKFISSLYQYIDSYFAHKFIFKTNYIFDSMLHKKLYWEPQESFYRPEFNDKLKKAAKGQEKIPFQVFSTNGIFIKLIVVLLVQIPLIVKESPLFLLLVFVDALFSLLVLSKLSKDEYAMEQRLVREQRRADYFGGIFSMKASAKELRVFGAQDFFYDRWSQLFSNLSGERECFQLKKQRRKLVTELWSFFNQGAMLVVLFYLLVKGKITASVFVFLYTIVPAVSEQCKDLVASLTEDMYGNYLDIENFREYVSEADASADSDREKIAFSELKVKNVSYIYPGGKRCAVQDVSFEVKKGEIVCILGYNGSGKTTLSKLLSGVLKPAEGEILLNGRKAEDYGKEERFELFGIAYQDFLRYMLSVEENIGYGYIDEYT